MKDFAAFNNGMIFSTDILTLLLWTIDSFSLVQTSFPDILNKPMSSEFYEA